MSHDIYRQNAYDVDRHIEQPMDTFYNDVCQDSLADPVIQNLIREVERSMEDVRHDLETQVRRKTGKPDLDVGFTELDRAIMAWKGLVR